VNEVSHKNDFHPETIVGNSDYRSRNDERFENIIVKKATKGQKKRKANWLFILIGITNDDY
jgi:hypothetical protein